MGVFLGFIFMLLLIWNWFHQYEKERPRREHNKRQSRIDKEIQKRRKLEDIEAAKWICSEPYCSNQVNEKWHSLCYECYKNEMESRNFENK